MLELNYPQKKSKKEILDHTASANLPKNQIVKCNTLYFGNNISVLKTMYDNAVKIDLVYIDPPYATQHVFADRDNNEAYADVLVGWEYVDFLRNRIIFAHELLNDTGSMYVHVDQKMGHYIKIVMDEVFGQKNFINDITRIKCNPKGFARKAFGNIKDVIYFYAKDKKNMYWSDYRSILTSKEIKKQFPKKDTDGNRYATTPLHAPGVTNGPTSKQWKDLMPPKGRHWRENPERLTEYDTAGLIEWSTTGNPRKKIFAKDHKGNKPQDIWEYKDPGASRENYPTQKNLDLLKFIIQCSTKQNDVVLDFFAGSGTTLIAAHSLDRKWIGVDQSPLAIEKTKNMLGEINIIEV